ncbi:MAG: SufE family protein [Candidatus Marinarcus sp.]|uniref:SufE family protein n=1 Tax=Candidatus Marinarcus sp. TaxID=3100987 RepID=UPI003B009181
MEFHNRVSKIKEELALFDDELEKYEYIIDLGKLLEPLDKEALKDENLVQGCTSKVWLIVEKQGDKLLFKATSDAQIVKGLVYIIITLFSNLTPQEILNTNIDVLDELELTEIITPNRQSGVTGMLKKIKQYAKALQ